MLYDSHHLTLDTTYLLYYLNERKIDNTYYTNWKYEHEALSAAARSLVSRSTRPALSIQPF